jgi:hypothetical protein
VRNIKSHCPYNCSKYQIHTTIPVSHPNTMIFPNWSKIIQKKILLTILMRNLKNLVSPVHPMKPPCFFKTLINSNIEYRRMMITMKTYPTLRIISKKTRNLSKKTTQQIQLQCSAMEKMALSSIIPTQIFNHGTSIQMNLK